MEIESVTPERWVSLGPRDDFGQLVRSRTYRPTKEERDVWSIVCFYVHGAARRRRVATALLETAVEHARRSGAKVIEAYPHDRGDYLGARAMFAAAGFEPAPPAGPRTIVRYRVP